MQAVFNNAGGLYFLGAHGGTGKTFVITLILAIFDRNRKLFYEMSVQWRIKKSLEAVRRIMQDLRGNQQIFSGALILLLGKFRQTRLQ